MSTINIIFENAEFIQIPESFFTYIHIRNIDEEHYFVQGNWHILPVAKDISFTIEIPKETTLENLVDLAQENREARDSVGEHVYGEDGNYKGHNNVGKNISSLERLLRFSDIAQIERVSENDGILFHYYVTYPEENKGDNVAQETKIQEKNGKEYIEVNIKEAQVY